MHGLLMTTKIMQYFFSSCRGRAREWGGQDTGTIGIWGKNAFATSKLFGLLARLAS